MGERRNGEDYGDSDDKDVRSGYTGYVKMYSTLKGWGFIICKDVDKDVFFHVRNILDGPPRQDIDSTKGEYWEAEFDCDLSKPNNPTAWKIRLWQKAHGNRQPMNAAAALASSSSYNYYRGGGGASGGGGGQSSSSYQSSGRPWRTASSTAGDTYSSQGGGSSSSDWHKPKQQDWDSGKDYKDDKWGSNSNRRGGEGGGGGGGGWSNNYSSSNRDSWGYNASSSSWHSKAAPATGDYDDRYETELLKPGRRVRQETVQADESSEGRYRSYRDSQATSEPTASRASRGDRDYAERGGERDRDHAGRWSDRDRERDRGDNSYGRDRQKDRDREQRDSGYRDRDYQQQDSKQQRGDHDYRDNNSRGGGGGRGSERGSRGPDHGDPPQRPRGASDGRGGSGSFADAPERGSNSYNQYRERIPRDGADTRDRSSRGGGGGGGGDAYQSSSARDFADRGRDGRERDRRDEKKPWRDGSSSGAAAEDDRRDRRRSSGMGDSSRRGAAGGASAGSRSRGTVPLPPPRSSAAAMQALPKKPALPRRSLPRRSRDERRSRSPRHSRRSPPPSGQPKSKASAGPLRSDVAQLPPGDWEGGASHYMILLPPSAAEAFDMREAVEIEKRSGARLKLHRSEYRNTGDRILEVEADVGHALKDAMLRIIREVVRHKGGRLADGNCELRVLLTRPVASSVIGVKGRNVQSINALTGCRVQVSTTDRDATMQTSVIRGPDAGSILKVCSIIHTFIQNPSWPRSNGGHTSRPWSARESKGGSRPEESGKRRHQDGSEGMEDAAEEERADAADRDAMADVNDDMVNQHHDEDDVEGTCELDPYVQVDDEEGYDQGPDGDAPFFDETVVVENLPYPWVAVEHPEEPGTFYYHNEETGEATWYPPTDGGAEGGGGEYQDEPDQQQAEERSRSRSRLSIRNEDI